MNGLDEKHNLYKTELLQISREVEQLNKEYKSQLESLQKAKSITSEKESELAGLRYKHGKRSQEVESHQKAVNELKENLKNKKQLIESFEQELINQEELRRKLHNKIQELKGNIRVFCRIRPAVKDETKLADVRVFGEDNESIELRDESVSAMGRTSNRMYNFTFDRIFPMEATQKDCFTEISQLVQSALDGYNVCIFAYGQTGSGKTYTMQGSSEDAGMIPRTVEQIYNVAQKLKPLGWDYNMTGQFLEIYNESIHDLLGNVADYGKVKHDIHHDKNGKTTVTDITTVQLNTPNQVRLMLKRANHNRATASTNLNDRSSRSHSVFTLHIIGANKSTGEELTGILNLIDLAGSERLSMSGAVGDRLKETQAINKSLSCLSKVIQSLATKKKEGSHIPYRDSKLTYLLRNSLGGNCKTLMFVNVSPLSDHFGETLCSLRFAETVNSTKLGNIKKMASLK
ncbi:C-terminal kinesin [Backusella circina FSU 941]|nr:C-terminal kinesin [Backusella circina FSU 941]